MVAFAGHNNTHMISGSADGVMCLWKCNKDWTCLHTIRVHTGEVISLALHPSSRLALSVGADKLLKIWNLLTGKLSHSLTLEHIPSQVLFNPSGTLFAIVFPDPKQILLCILSYFIFVPHFFLYLCYQLVSIYLFLQVTV